MNFLLRTAGAMLCAAAMLALTAPAPAMLALTAPAHAVLVYVDSAGNAVAAPPVMDAGNEAVYLTETPIPGGGRYDVTNNTVCYGLLFSPAFRTTAPSPGSRVSETASPASSPGATSR